MKLFCDSPLLAARTTSGGMDVVTFFAAAAEYWLFPLADVSSVKICFAERKLDSALSSISLIRAILEDWDIFLFIMGFRFLFFLLFNYT